VVQQIETNELAPGELVGQFEVKRLIGRGGNGEVYLARDMTLGRKVALKLIRRDVLGSKGAMERFLLEARATARFSHPHIVTIYAAGEHKGRPYVALEYLDGEPLRRRLVSDPPGAKESLRIVLAVARALAEAHKHKLLHRDLKPENVIIPKDGRLRVVDFGLAKEIAPDVDQGEELPFATTLPGPLPVDTQGLAGTPLYMAPEQWRKKPVSEATDVWMLGVMFYEILAGQRPFEAQSPLDIALKVTETDAPPLPEGIEAPSEIRDLLARCLSREVATRPSAEEIASTIEAALDARAKSTAELSPFRGLLPFTEEHSELFFGRESEIATFLERMRDEAFLPIVGPSGAGKSSFVHAGVVPRLRERGRWTVLTMRPGQRPFHALASRLLHPDHPSARSPQQISEPKDDRGASLGTEEVEVLAGALASTPHRLSLELRRITQERGTHVLLVVDQLEEIETLVSDKELKSRFMYAICSSADDALDPVRIVLTVRDDFLGRLAEAPEIRRALSKVTVLRSPGPVDLEEIVASPVKKAGYRFDDLSLPREMVSAVGSEPAALPLLQFACRLLWERRDREQKLLTRAAYERIGGVAGALATHADGVIDGLSAEDAQSARRILLRLVTADGTRRVLARKYVLEGLGDAASMVLDRLIEARLVSVRRRSASTTVEDTEIELAHESLIRAWSRLARWIAESKEEITILVELSQAAELWERRGAQERETWEGEALHDASRALAKLAEPPPPRVARFIAAGLRRKAKKKRIRAAAIAGIMVLLAAIAAVFYDQKLQAEEQRARAEAEEAIAMKRHAEGLYEAARGALASGEIWQSRAKLRASLEAGDTAEARALWAEIEALPLVFERKFPAQLLDVSVLQDPPSLLVMPASKSMALVDLESYAIKEVPTSAVSGMSSAASPSGALVAMATNDNRVILHDLRSHRERILGSHSASVWRLAFSDDEKHLASAGWDGKVRVFSLANGKEERTLDHADRAYGVSFDPTGRFIATGCWDGKVQLWPFSGGEPILIEDTKVRVMDVRFSPDGKRLAAAVDDGSIRIWPLEPRAPAIVLRGHEARVSAVAFRSDGRVLASAGWDRSVRLWHLDQNAQMEILGLHSDVAYGVAFSPKGDRVASASYDGVLKIWRADRPRAQRMMDRTPKLPPPQNRAMALSPDGALVAWPDESSTVQIIDRESGELLHLLHGHTNVVLALAFSPKGELLASSGRDRTIRLWDTRSGALVGLLSGHDRDVFWLGISPDGRRLVSGADDRTVRIWDLASGRTDHVLPIQARGLRGTITADGRRVAVQDLDGTVFVWSLADGRSTAVVRTTGATSFSLVGSDHLALLDQEGRLKVTELGSSLPSRIMTGYSEAGCIAALPGSRLAYAAPQAPIRITDLEGRVEETLPRAPANILACEASRDGAWLVTHHGDRTVRTWDLNSRVPHWRGPYLGRTSSTGVEALTHLGWSRLDGAGSTDSAAKWRERIASSASRSDLAADGRSVCLVTHAGELELWDKVQDQLRFTTSAPSAESFLAAAGACFVLFGGELRHFDSTGASSVIAKEVTAIAKKGSDGVIAASGKEVVEIDAEGRTRSRFEGRSGATAILASDDHLALGFEDGRIELSPRDRSSSSITLAHSAPSAVLRLELGARGTIAAGYADGTAALFRLDNGARIHERRLNAPVAHLLFADQHLYVLSELGAYAVLDLSPLEMDRCELVKEMWKRSPARWDRGAAREAPPPATHPCNEARFGGVR
jgi:WD40 repeat protein/serine/threonine protein kinase